METVRSFIAIELPAEIKQGLTRLQSRLKAATNCPARWVAPDGIHLTLNFLGDVAIPKVNDIKQVMIETCAEFTPFELRLAGLGVFPNLDRPQVVWVGLGGDLDSLIKLQKQLAERLIPLGFRPEKRSFSPHLTLARLREEASPDERKRLGGVIATTACDIKCVIPVESVNLMRSQLTPAGAIYSRLGAASLNKVNSKPRRGL